jgi:hypothetical protein
MPNLNAGFKNNINAVTVRATGTVSHVYTDRAIDFNGDGVKEQVTSVGTPTGVGNNVTFVVTRPQGAPRTIIHSDNETDGGFTPRIGQFTAGI